MLTDAVWSYIRPWFDKTVTNTAAVNTITLRCTTGNGLRIANGYDKLPDTHYHAVVWYIANIVKHIGEYGVDVDEYVAGGKSIPLILGTVNGITTDYLGTTITISHTVTTSSTRDQRLCDLRMEAQSNDHIIGFMNHCLGLFRDAQERDSGTDLTVFLTGNRGGQPWHGYRMRIVKTFENTYYPPEVRATLIGDATEFTQSEARYKKLGIPYKRGYLLYGPMGTGKSSAWYALARTLNRNVYKLSLDATTVDTVRYAVSAVPPNSIMVIDDIDALPFSEEPVKKPNAATEDGEFMRIASRYPSINISTILDILDGYDYLHGCIVVFTSNYPERLDKRLLRSGRIDLSLHIGYPTVQVIRDMFKYVYGQAPDIPADTEITITTADIMSRVITVHPDYDSAVRALTELLVEDASSDTSSGSPLVE